MSECLIVSVCFSQSGRKETVLDLAKFVDKGVQVKLTGGRQGKPSFSDCAPKMMILFTVSLRFV